ncbi:hypothetical protein [Sphingopyxis fribergensis]|uniref:hypothetical protein n=1 Tax=Sphingopyxis fribergensis TaxID=1515612 RepID=UPI00069089E1|nr:hypothetical protein [Sphingopyxis fribergensis]
MAAMRAGKEWDEADRQVWWRAYYDWLERILFTPGRWAIMPDSPAAPSQLNDGLLNDWPFGDRGAPVWHMDGSIERLARLCDRYSRVCLGWIGDPKREPVGCDAYHRKMDEVAALMGNTWHPLHMLRGTLVARQYPFASADSTSLAQNGHRYDYQDGQHDAFTISGKWSGRNRYADRLELGLFGGRVQSEVRTNRTAALRPQSASRTGPVDHRTPVQLGLL